MDGHGLDRRDANGSFHFSQAAEFELINLRKGVWILPVVLYYVDVVGDGEETGEGRGLGIP